MKLAKSLAKIDRAISTGSAARLPGIMLMTRWLFQRLQIGRSSFQSGEKDGQARYGRYRIYRPAIAAEAVKPFKPTLEEA